MPIGRGDTEKGSTGFKKNFDAGRARFFHAHERKIFLMVEPSPLVSRPIVEPAATGDRCTR
jgi:hypothetical protein